MSAPMINLDSKNILNKPVVTSDGYLRGHIVGQTDKELVLIEGTWRVRKYNIPKSLVTNFDGSYIYISIPDKEMEKYRAK
ncbi:MAG: hypothetical protein NZ888_01170 [Candidatus Nitrosocaldus sp.]|nr:hypothetical protein [Candidatus Nitrosocaldus sp.]MDW8000953.1 hypothetical protein [Candidatus Nitrosocaldus sp.]